VGGKCIYQIRGFHFPDGSGSAKPAGGNRVELG
jgi:hypothetical protein